MNKLHVAITLALAISGVAQAQKPPLLPEKDIAALANELNGETAKRNLEAIGQFHRQRGSQGYHKAAELVAEHLRAYGLSDVTILQFPADGKIYYGTQRSRPAWDAEVGDLWEARTRNCPTPHYAPPAGVGMSFDCGLEDSKTVASYATNPVVLAEDSESADVTGLLVDVGEGTEEKDYAGKNAKGNIVLVSAQPSAVQDLAVGKFGAVGIVSYAQNQKTAWSGENQDAIRWGHLDTFSKNKTFAFMVSLKTAHAFQERLKQGENVLLHAIVKAGQHPGNYEVVTASIPGADAKLKDEEIVFSCHLDHQKPGANDNASGCATILEVARTLQKLFSEGKLTRPARTIRLVFPPEIEGTLALLNGRAQFDRVSGTENAKGSASIRISDYVFPGPELTKRIKAVVHMDMVGGGPETKAVFHVTRGPMSLPSFVHDVAWAFAEFVNEQSYQYAATGKAAYPLLSPEGGKEPLRAEYSFYTMGSDHDVYQDSSFGIPAIYLNDWPDRFIHTNLDTPANIDSTKLKRAAFIGAASGYFLAGMEEDAAQVVLAAIDAARLLRWNSVQLRSYQLSDDEAGNFIRQSLNSDLGVYQSIKQIVPQSITLGELTFERFAAIEIILDRAGTPHPATGSGLLVFRRKKQPTGPMAAFGYDYFEAEWAKQAHTTKPKLLDYEGLWGRGEEYAYEVLNFADGDRNAQQIRDAVSAEYGPVSLDMVVEYLKALEAAGVVERVE